VGCFGGHSLPNALQQPGQPEEVARESSSTDPPEAVHACRDSRVARASHDLRRGTGQPF